MPEPLAFKRHFGLNVMQFIENRTFDELHIGDTAEVTRPLRPEDIELLAVSDGQTGAIADPGSISSTPIDPAAAHGMWGGFISELLSTELPGPGTIYVDLSLHFRQRAAVGDIVTARIRVRDMVTETNA